MVPSHTALCVCSKPTMLLLFLEQATSRLTTALRHDVSTLGQFDCPPSGCVASGAADSRHLQHPFQLPDHDVAVHLDVTASKSSGA
jgi:hypothetical protein